MMTLNGSIIELNITVFEHCDLIEISGRIDSYSAPQIEAALEALLLDDHYNIIVDLQHVTFVSSSGMLVFVNIQRKLNRQNKGRIALVQVPDLVFSSFELAGFNTIFNFFDDSATAVGSF